MEGRGRFRAIREPILIDRRGALSLLATTALSACARARPDPHAARVAMVTDYGGLGDHGFNDSANAGLQAAKRQFGVATVVLQSRSVNDYQVNMMALANERFSEVFCIGYDQAADLGEVARRFPQQHFSIIDAVVAAPNVTSVLFREQEGSFLAGALAALTTRTKTIGFLGGVDIPIIQTFEAGYAAGARQIDPSVKVLVKYVGTFDDVPAGKELTGLLFGEHADIVYTAAGKAGLGAMQQLQGRDDAYVIGVDSDQDALVPGKILTSVLKRIDVSVFTLCKVAVTGKPRPPRLILGLREGGVGLTDFHYSRAVVTPAIIARLAAIRAAIVRGSIIAPASRGQLATYTRVRI